MWPTRARVPPRAAAVDGNLSPFRAAGHSIGSASIPPSSTSQSERSPAPTSASTSSRQRQICRCDQLRATLARRPQPLLAPGGERVALVELGGIPLPLRRHRRRQPDATRQCSRHQPRRQSLRSPHAQHEPRGLRRRAARPGDTRFLPGLPFRLLPPRRSLRLRDRRRASWLAIAFKKLGSNGSATTPSKTARQGWSGRSLRRARRRASWRFSAGPHRGIRSGTSGCWTRLSSAIRPRPEPVASGCRGRRYDVTPLAMRSPVSLSMLRQYSNARSSTGCGHAVAEVPDDVGHEPVARRVVHARRAPACRADPSRRRRGAACRPSGRTRRRPPTSPT